MRAPAALLLGLGLAVSGCSRSESDEGGGCACDAALVDEPLLAYLSRARAAHHQADLAEDSEQFQTAIASLTHLVAAPTRLGERPEVQEVMADTYARLAELESRIGRFDAAERYVHLGLRLAPRPTYYRGHLLEVQGVVEQRRYEFLSKEGRPEDAARAKRKAIEAFEASMTVQESVIEKGPMAPAHAADKQPR